MADSDCIIFSKCVYHSFKMSLQGGKERVKGVVSVNYCPRVSTQLQLTNISYITILDTTELTVSTVS